LAEYFLEKHAVEAGKRTPELSQEEVELLVTHDWPGNIRELGNLARKVVALGQNTGGDERTETSRAGAREKRSSWQGTSR